MRVIKLLFLLFFICRIFQPAKAENVDVEVNPPEPLVNENFFVTFKIKSSGNIDPYISFTPSGATVQGKSEQGVSISTTVINGKMTTTREQNYVYELMADRAGGVSLRNIKVEINGSTTTLKDVNINVLSQARRVQDAFMEAQTSKTKVYVGEGLDVNYYLYFKTSIAANDVKEFPKLNKFIKRFHHVNSPVETVQYKGQFFKRILAYSARLYPEKVGTAILDPMTIAVQIVEDDYNSPFGGFGMGGQRYKNKDLSSPRIEIQVLPLPTENIPAGFTGLVGEHEFNLSIPKNKFLVNEPIEIKLEVKGKGALENLDAPTLYSDNNLEAFDTKSEVTELGSQAAKKVFEFTLLGRGPLSIRQREMALSYFDPSFGRYIEKKVTIPSLEVEGIAVEKTNSTSPMNSQVKADKPSQEDDFFSRLFSSKNLNNSSAIVEKNQLGIVGPNLKGEGRWLERWVDVFNIILVFCILSYLGYWYCSCRNNNNFSDKAAEAKKIITQMKKHGLNYSDLYRMIGFLDSQNKLSQGGYSINQLLDDSTLSNDGKDYFKKTLRVCEEKNFGINKQDQRMVYEKKYFKEILRNI